MALECLVCNKKPLYGNRVSHANNRRRHRAFPNLQRVKALWHGGVRHIRVCTRCLRSGLIQKAA